MCGETGAEPQRGDSSTGFLIFPITFSRRFPCRVVERRSESMLSAMVQLWKIHRNPAFWVEGAKKHPGAHLRADAMRTIHIKCSIGEYSDFARSRKRLMGVFLEIKIRTWVVLADN